MAEHVPTDDEIELMSAQQVEEFLATGTVSTPIITPASQAARRSSSLPAHSGSGGEPDSPSSSHAATSSSRAAQARSHPTAMATDERRDASPSAIPASRWLEGAYEPIDPPASSWGWMVVGASLVGIASCWHLIAAEIDQLKNPMGSLSCDINPLVSCGASLNVWQGNLLGVPNAFIGAMAFAALAVLGGLSACGVKLPRMAWWGMLAGSLGGLVFVGWFLAVSVLTFHKLCPYCMIIWAMTIPIATTTWGWAGRRGVIGPPSVGPRLFAGRWWAAFALILLIIAVIGVSFAGQWALLLS